MIDVNVTTDLVPPEARRRVLDQVWNRLEAGYKEKYDLSLIEVRVHYDSLWAFDGFVPSLEALPRLRWPVITPIPPPQAGTATTGSQQTVEGSRGTDDGSTGAEKSEALGSHSRGK